VCYALPFQIFSHNKLNAHVSRRENFRLMSIGGARSTSSHSILLGSRILGIFSGFIFRSSCTKCIRLCVLTSSCYIRLGQVRCSFVNVRKVFGSFRRVRDCSDYRLDRIEGVAIADPETGSSPGDLLHLTCCNAFWELHDL
jgi:hypothetical protein